MEFEIKNGLFSEFIGFLNTVNNQANIVLNEKGIKSVMVDPSHICMCSVQLEKELFESFDFENELSVNVSVDKFLKILKLGKSDDLVKVKFGGVNVTILIGRLKRSMRLLDASTVEVPNLPDLTFPNTIIIKKEELVKAVKAIIDFTDYIMFDVNKDGFTMKSSGELDEMEMAFEKDELVEFDFGKEGHSSFGLDYFKPVLEYMPEDTKLHIDDGYPMEISFEKEEGKFVGMVLIAPRLE